MLQHLELAPNALHIRDIWAVVTSVAFLGMYLTTSCPNLCAIRSDGVFSAAVIAGFGWYVTCHKLDVVGRTVWRGRLDVLGVARTTAGTTCGGVPTTRSLDDGFISSRLALVAVALADNSISIRV
jgi:hypothetical protein